MFLWLVVLVFFTNCSKETRIPNAPNINPLLGEWTLFLETRDEFCNDLITFNFNCNIDECHRLLFTERTYTFYDQYEDFFDEQGGEYKVDQNRIICLSGNKGLSEYDSVLYKITYDEALNSHTLLISYIINEPYRRGTLLYSKEEIFQNRLKVCCWRKVQNIQLSLKRSWI